LVWEWIRHRAGALAATAVDFGIMIGSVELLHLGPVVSTVAGALCGAMTNFLLGRGWIFHRTDAAAWGQAIRYAMVSGASLGLNALGEYALAVRLGVAYLPARVIVATVVGNLWNYPLHKFFVFAPSRRELPHRASAKGIESEVTDTAAPANRPGRV
jgi:putative flippase GtrA